MNIIKLYQDYSIPALTEGNSHCQPGWINTHCPFCAGSKNYHLGYNLENNYFFCWRCGWHSISDTISKLLHTSKTDTKRILREYKDKSYLVKEKKKAIQITKKHFKTPSNLIPLTRRAKKYLINRNFNPEEIIEKWNIQSTGPVSGIDGISYSHRIFIPFYWNKRLVTFQARDITNKQRRKYMACSKEREIINIKQILYGKQEKWTNTGICVEGVTDVWRFGVHSFAVLGLQFTSIQVRLIAKNFKHVFVCFDGGEQNSKIAANKLVAELRFRGIEAERIDIIGDPGDMEQEKADKLVNELINL